MKTMLAPESQTPSLSSKSHAEVGSLSDRVDAIQDEIACLAYQLFEVRGREHGHDLEDWLRAESEILLPISVEVYEFEDELIARAQLPFFTADDIEVRVEPRRVIISDHGLERIQNGDEAKPPRSLCHTLAIPDRVDWTKAVSIFDDGVLQISLPKIPAIDGGTV